MDIEATSKSPLWRSRSLGDARYRFEPLTNQYLTYAGKALAHNGRRCAREVRQIWKHRTHAAGRYSEPGGQRRAVLLHRSSWNPGYAAARVVRSTQRERWIRSVHISTVSCTAYNHRVAAPGIVRPPPPSRMQ